MSREDDYAEHRWQDFQRLPVMGDHWHWRPGWRVGRSFYTWHLTFEHAPEVRRLAALYQSRINLPFLDPVPPQGLHLTVQGVGFTDEIGEDDLRAVIAAARERCRQLAPFTVDVGPADADAQGVPLALKPWAPIEQLRTTVREAIADVWGVDGVPEAADGFHPHITIFYSNAAADPAPLRQPLTELRGTPPVRTTARTVSLIRLNRDDKVYRWETVVGADLGNGR